MAKRKRSKRTEKTSRTSKSLRVDSSLLTTLIDEIDELVELLRFLPELNILSTFFQEWAREMEETVVAQLLGGDDLRTASGKGLVAQFAGPRVLMQGNPKDL